MLMIIVLLRYYEGSMPVIVTSDPEMIKEVFIKQFNNFYGRRVSIDIKVICLNSALAPPNCVIGNVEGSTP